MLKRLAGLASRGDNGNTGPEGSENTSDGSVGPLTTVLAVAAAILFVTLGALLMFAVLGSAVFCVVDGLDRIGGRWGPWDGVLETGFGVVILLTAMDIFIGGNGNG